MTLYEITQGGIARERERCRKTETEILTILRGQGTEKEMTKDTEK